MAEFRDTPDERAAQAVLGAAMKVHSLLGPGLLESAYEACLFHELTKTGHAVERQKPVTIIYDGVNLDAGYRIDLLVDQSLVVEMKAVDRLQPIHSAQLLSYLKLGGYRLGLLLNFNVLHMRDGIKRILNGY